jgi:hypothetical protein
MTVGVFVAVCVLCINLQGPDPSSYAFPALVLIGILLGYLRLRDIRLPEKVVVATLVFIAFYAISAVAHFADIRLVFILAANLSILFVLKLYIRSKDQMRVVFFGLLWGAVICSLLALAANARMWIPGSLFFEIIRSDRWQGLMGDSNIYALYLSLLTFWLIDETLKPKLWKNNALIKILMISFLVPQIGATLSRSGWLCFFCGICCYCFLAVYSGHLRRVGGLIILGTGLLIVSAWIISIVGYAAYFVDRVSLLAQPFAEETERINLAYTVRAIKLAARNPLGVGVGQTSAHIVNALGLPVGAHNAFIQVLSDNGWIPFIFMVFIAATIGFPVIRKALKNEIQFGVSYQFIFSALVGLFVTGMFHDLLYWPIGWLVPALAMVMLWHPTVPGSPF